jgi:hypothetical protein
MAGRRSKRRIYNNKFDLFKDSSNSAKMEGFNKKNHFLIAEKHFNKVLYLPKIIMDRGLSVYKKRKMGIAFPIGSCAQWFPHLVAERNLLQAQLMQS